MAETSITEKFEFNTSILTSYDGHEQRIKTRQYPRHFVSYKYDAMDASQAQWMRAQARIRQSDVMYIPMWQNSVKLTEDHYGGYGLTIDPEYMYSFYMCDAIEIFSHDDVMGFNKVNLQKLVKQYTGDKIVMKNTLDRYLNKKTTYIFPLLRCATLPDHEFDYIFSNGSSTTLNFEQITYKPTVSIPNSAITEYNYDIDQFNRFNLPEKYNERDVLLNTPTWVDDDANKVTIGKHANLLDNKSGIFKYDLKNSKSYDIMSFSLLLRNKRMIFNLIKFFANSGGMYKSFYVPTWANDFDVQFDIKYSNNYFVTKLSGIFQYYISNTRKRKIIIFTKDWKSYIYDIATYSYVTIDGQRYGKVIVSKPFGINFDVKNILQVSFFSLVRFYDDTLTLNYETTDVATTTITMKEVDDDE